MRIYSSIIALLFFAITYGQQEIDSLKNELSKAQADSSRIKTYLQFFKTNMFYDDQEKVIDYTYKALTLSKKSNYPKGEIEAYNNLGYTYRTRSETDSAFKNYELAIKTAKEIGFYKGLTDAHIGKGNTLNQINMWNEAIEEFNLVIEIARKKGDSIQIGSAHNNIGNTFLNQSKYEDALKHYQQSLALGDDYIREVALINMAVVHGQIGNLEMSRKRYQESLDLATKLNKKGHIAFIYKNLGVLEKKSENFNLAIDYYHKALEHYQGISDDFNVSEILQNIGNLYLAQEKYENAIDYYNQSLEIQKTIDLKSGICYNYLTLGQAYAALGRLNKALTAAETVENCSSELDMLNLKSDAAQLMSNILGQQGNYKKALEYHVIHKTLSDSLAAINSREKVAELDTKYQTSQKEQEINLLSAENEVNTLQLQHQKNLKNYLILAAIFLTLLIAVLYNRYQIKARTTDKLRELDTLKTNFFTNISHEFRTPLTLILNPLSRILNEGKENENTSDLRLVKRNAERLLQLTNQLLDLSKLEAGKLTLEISWHNLNDFIEITTSSFASLADSKNINFHLEKINLRDEGYFDVDKLQKILNNLLSNAIKFTPSGGSVLLKAEGENNNLHISVKDTGPGIDESELDQIFDRFHQGLKTENQGGTGIGLTLTRELVQLHKGSIVVESNKQMGSIFKLTIPIGKENYSHIDKGFSKIADELKIPLLTNKNQFPDQTEMQVKPIALVVEDNLELNNFIASLLLQDFQIISSLNGKDGLEKAIENIPDIIISDWMMPEMDGYMLCEKLKTDERTSHIPIILLTAKAEQPSKIEALKIGADEYLTKPFDNEELKIRVKNLVDQRSKLRAKFSEAGLLETSNLHISDPDKSFIERAKAIVEDHISDPDFTVERFQEELGMSKSQLHRKLSAITNESASRFIRNYRLQRASQFFKINGYNVSEVAYQCGFNSVSYFTQCFKEKFGVTPTEYQNQSHSN